MATEFGKRSEIGNSETHEINTRDPLQETMDLIKEFWQTERGISASRMAEPSAAVDMAN